MNVYTGCTLEWISRVNDKDLMEKMIFSLHLQKEHWTKWLGCVATLQIRDANN